MMELLDDDDKFFWFWNSNDKSLKKSEEIFWTPYDLIESSHIEQEFCRNKTEAKVQNHLINFKNMIQYNIKDQNKQREVLRAKLRDMRNCYRRFRFHDIFPEAVANGQDKLLKLTLFSLNEIFCVFKKNDSRAFITNLYDSLLIMDEIFAKFLNGQYLSYLRQTYKFSQVRDLSFKVLVEMLLQDFNKREELKEYLKYIKRICDEETFIRFIVKMYTIEGFLYKNVNNVLRALSYEILEQNKELVLYILLLMHAVKTLSMESKKQVTNTFYRGIKFPLAEGKAFLNTYKINNCVILKEFLSTSKNITTAKKFAAVKKDEEKLGILFQITMQDADPAFCTMKSAEITMFSIYKEEEFLLNPFNAFKITQVKYIRNNYVKIEMEAMNNYIKSTFEQYKNGEFVSDKNLSFGYLTKYEKKKEIPYYKILDFEGKMDNFLKFLSATQLQRVRLDPLEDQDFNYYLLTDILKRNGHIYYLHLSHNKLGISGMEALSKTLSFLPYLKELYLGFNEICDAGAEALAKGIPHSTKISNIPFLEVLDLRNNEIGDDGIESLSKSLPYLGNLKVFDLFLNEITENGMEILANAMQHLPNLVQIDLYGNKIRSGGAKALALCFPSLTKIKYINIENCGIEDQGIIFLCKTIPLLNDLKELLIGENSFGKEAAVILLETIEKKKGLNVVHITSGKIDKDSLEKFKKNKNIIID